MDGFIFIITVGRPQNFLEEINQEKTNFIRPGVPIILVKKLTKKIITEAIGAYGEGDGYWLKIYHFANSVAIYLLDKLEAEYCEEQK